MAWVVIEYPDNVEIPNNDKDLFEKNCKIQTSAAFSGSDYCKIDLQERVIMIQNVYSE